ncbi:hypothetical protein DH2020_031371 [Rehmannia glutinosa]|uniref:Uncharacterized protein n=1 Tax=Rehmannia glutinosa TaxID=99300 RepID=A0ABR0VIY2_REHGL
MGSPAETGTGTSNITTNGIIEKQLLKFIESEVDTLRLPMSSPYIYKVSKELRNGHSKLFDPISISIGPLHYDEMSPAQELKKWFLKNFLDRVEKVRVTKQRVAEVISSLEKHARESYRDIDTGVTEYVFSEIMLLDGCFIVELLLSQDYKDFGTSTLVGNTEKVPFLTLQQDLLKIENQLPFNVLKHLADLALSNNSQGNTKTPENKNPTLIELALKFFNISKPESFKIDNPRHLLELAMNALFHKTDQDPNQDPSAQTIQVDPETFLSEAKSASDLEIYGVEFQAGKSKNLTDIQFSNGVFTIPPLTIQESTATRFWNFLVFEMSSSSSRIFTSYVVLMDTLINNEKDVEVLLRSKILLSRDNDIRGLVSLSNDLSANVRQRDFYFEPLIQKVNRYCGSGFRPQRAYLVRNYYDARWDVLNNALLFIFTVTQTLFSVLSYKPKGQ